MSPQLFVTILDLAGTYVFALSGALCAVRARLDLFGIGALAVATGVGGGMVRDVLLGAHPPVALRDERYLVACLLGGATVALVARHLNINRNAFLVADAVGLAVFAGIGATKATDANAGVLTTCGIAALTAVGGGVIRDLLLRQVPTVLTRDIYATAAAAGGATYLLARRLHADAQTAFWICCGVTLMLRLGAMQLRLSLPVLDPEKSS